MSFCPRCSKPLDQRAVVCPHCGYDFPPSPRGLASGASWFDIVFGSLWVAGGVALVFLSPGQASDWWLAGFAVTGGLAGILAAVRQLLGADAARRAGAAAAVCAVLATAAGIASVWLGAREGSVLVWLIVVGGAGVVWAGAKLVRPAGRRHAERPDG